MGIIALITAVIGIIAILLKDYIPGWSKKHQINKEVDNADDFGKELMAGDDLGASRRLVAELDRVQRKQADSSSK